MRPLRVLFVMNDSGGGHRAAAEALAACLLQAEPRAEAPIVDLWSRHTPWPIQTIPNLYPLMVNRFPRVWRALWHATDGHAPGSRLARGLIPVVRASMAEALLHHEPALVVSVHPLLQEIPLRVLRSLGGEAARAPFVTVVTDLASAHTTWFEPDADLCCVPTDLAAARAMAHGVPADRIRVHGLPVRPAFGAAAPPKPEARRHLGLAPHVPLALVLGGGEGVGRLDTITEAIAAALAPSPSAEAAGQVAVICGRNAALARRLAARSWPVPVTVRGFVDDMADWMAAADCVVSKAGPGTIAEALTRGLPMVLTGYIPGQEEGNVSYVVDLGAGVYAPQPAEAARVVARWLRGDDAECEERAARAAAAARPDATAAIIREVLAIAPNRA